MIKTVLFDLDGTLLPMDQDVFVKHYFMGLAAKLAPLGYDAEKLVKSIWGGTAAMVKNNSSATNETVFWQYFTAVFGKKSLQDLPVFEDFYRNEFQSVQLVCGFAPEAAQVIRLIKDKGLDVILATNPIFPAIATQSRIRWAGLDASDFVHYTTYENSCHCKPNPDYYLDILQQFSLKAEECIMVGNDVGEDMIAAKLGMRVFLLTDCLINKGNADITQYPHGGFSDLIAFLENEMNS